MGRFLRAQSNTTVLSPAPDGTSGLTEAPIIGALGSGGFVVAWNWDEDPTQAGVNIVTSRRIFAADGMAVTGIDNLATTGSPNSLTALSGGGFAISVEAFRQAYLLRQSDIGGTIGGPILLDEYSPQLNDATRTLIQLPVTGPLPGQLVVSAFNNTNGGLGTPQVFRLNEDGSLVSGSLYTMPVTTNGIRPLIGGLSDGGYYVVAPGFVFEMGNLVGTDLVAQFFDRSGNASGGLVDLTPGERDDLQLSFTSTAALSNGGFVLAARPQQDPGQQDEPFVRIYDSAGTPVSGKIVLASPETGGRSFLSDENSSVTPLSDGSGFVATWANTDSIQAQAFDLRGAKIGPQYEVRVFEPGKYIESGGITTLINGALATVWREFFNSALSESITAQTFSLQSFAAWQGTSGADTFVSPDNGPLELIGSGGNDTLTGNAQGNILNGGAGNDVLDGGAGNDVFEYGSGNNGFDAVVGGTGIDEIRAVAHNAVIGLSSISGVESIIANTYNNVRITGTTAADTLSFNGTFVSGISYIDGGAGNDTIYGPRAASDLRGGAGNDTIFGGTGNDSVSGGGGNDSLNGGAGDDVYLVGPNQGFDSYSEYSGFDTIRATAANTKVGIGGGFLSTVERIDSGGFANVTIVGNTISDTLDFSQTELVGIAAVDGGGGHDRLIGSGGSDLIKGGAGNDAIDGGQGNDRLTGGAGLDVLTGGEGSDTFVFVATSESGVGTAKADRIIDFLSGTDVIDLFAIDANKALAGNQEFAFIGSNPFSGLGQLRQGVDANGHLALFGNTTGSLAPDFQISFELITSLSSTDFIL